MKHISCIVALLIIIATLSACQPTPEKPVVVGKGEEQVNDMMEKAKENEAMDVIQEPQETQELKKNTYQAPDMLEYSFEATSIHGVLMQINVDANIVIPKYSLPMAVVKPKQITFEQVENIIDLTSGDELLYFRRFAESVDTKTKFQHIIDNYMWEIGEAIKDKEAYGDLADKFIRKKESQIKELYKKMETAPDNYAAAAETFDYDAWKIERTLEDDGTITSYQLSEAEIQRRINQGSVLTKEMANPFELSQINLRDRYNYFVIGERPTAARLSFAASDDILNQSIRYLSGTRIMNIADRNLSKASTLSLTLDEAKTIAQTYVNAIDSSLTLSEVGVSIDYGLSTNENLSFATGYQLVYTRDFNGVNINYGHETIFAYVKDTKAIYKPPYFAEELIIGINNDGSLHYLTYKSPMEIIEMVGSDTTLLPMDDIDTIFKQYITMNGMDSQDGIYININEIKLGLMRIDKPNARNEYLIVPVWDFYGSYAVTYTENGKKKDTRGFYLNEYRTGATLLTINAVDGSIINRDSGY